MLTIITAIIYNGRNLDPRSTGCHASASQAKELGRPGSWSRRRLLHRLRRRRRSHWPLYLPVVQPKKGGSCIDINI